MKLLPTTLPGLKLVQLAIHSDNRGFFVERFHARKMSELGINENFVQDNHSRSRPNVLRGLHYQNDPAQGKLVSVVNGKIWDVAVDIRKGSDTFGKHFSVELSDENGLALWIPAGFAHGFLVLGEEPADVTYKVSGEYRQGAEGGILWNDRELNIPWPIKEPILSERDKNLNSFSEYLQTPKTNGAP